jgi:hypothetical protein
MMWIDIGVIVLLTLRIALCRPSLPQLVDPNNDLSLPEEKDEQQECLFVDDGEVNEHSPRESSSGNSRAFAIAYSCNFSFEGTSVTSSCLPNAISHKGALPCCVEAVHRAFLRLVER